MAIDARETGVEKHFPFLCCFFKINIILSRPNQTNHGNKTNVTQFNRGTRSWNLLYCLQLFFCRACIRDHWARIIKKWKDDV